MYLTTLVHSTAISYTWLLFQKGDRLSGNNSERRIGPSMRAETVDVYLQWYSEFTLRG
jgi:hypothetical protein